jgi:hypothetical protein
VTDTRRCAVNALHELHGDRATWTTCRACEDWIRARLDDIERYWPMLPDYLEPGRGHSGVRGARAVHAPLPLAEEVLNLIGPGGASGRLAEHDAAIRSARGLPGETVTGSADYRMRTVLKNLRNHLAWAAANIDLLPLATTARALTGQMGHIVGEPSGPLTLAAPCPVVYDTGPCTGQLTYDRQTHAVACGDCGHVIPQQNLLPAAR